jgi:hypothetical protein
MNKNSKNYAFVSDEYLQRLFQAINVKVMASVRLTRCHCHLPMTCDELGKYKYRIYDKVIHFHYVTCPEFKLVR